MTNLHASIFIIVLLTCLPLIPATDYRHAIRFFAHHKLFGGDSKTVTQNSISQHLNQYTGAINCKSLAALYGSQFTEKIISQDQLIETCDLVDGCPTPASMNRILTLIRNNVTDDISLGDAMDQICPVLLSQSRSMSCGSEPFLTQDPLMTPKHSPLVVWGLAFLCVTIISLTSLVGVVIVPFLNKTSYVNVLNLFEGLAVGSLVGSALFHLIPQSFDLLLNTGTKHTYLWRALFIFFGIYMFYWSEKIMNLISSHKEGVDKSYELTEPQDNCEDGKSSRDAVHPESSVNSLEQRIRKASVVIAAGHTHAHEHVVLTGNNKKEKIAAVAWMIIFGDGLHNFIDGLSIGAAFNDSILTGLSICVAVVCEEFPHELGDFAVLIASGMSIKQAVGYNLLSACTW